MTGDIEVGILSSVDWVMFADVVFDVVVVVVVVVVTLVVVGVVLTLLSVGTDARLV